jgi:NADH-quinone oxidoreductase subunit M
MAPIAVVEYAPFIAVLSIIGILYAALICWVQSDIKKLVAYSSVSHPGFCVLGLFALNPLGAQGSVRGRDGARAPPESREVGEAHRGDRG